MNDKVHPLIGLWFMLSSLVSLGTFGVVFLFWLQETTCEKIENVYDCGYVIIFEPADPEESD